MPPSDGTPHPVRVIAKALFIVLALNAAYAYVSARMGHAVGLGPLLPARSRFPIYARGHTEQTPGQFSIQNVFDVPTLFWSHIVARTPRSGSEYRVFLLGDSTVRDSSLAEHLQAAGLTKCGGMAVQVYSLGYYDPSIMKDLILLRESLQYRPDLVVWFFEQEALRGEPKAFARSNGVYLAGLMGEYDLPGHPGRKLEPGWYADSIVGQRTRLNLQVRLIMDTLILRNALGHNDAAVTQLAIREISAAAENSVNPAWRRIANSYSELRPGLPAHPAQKDYLLAGVVAGQALTAPVPVILVNEPVNLGAGDGQYDPRQYGPYSEVVAQAASAHDWTLLNLWDLVPAGDFVDRVHHSPAGDKLVEQRLVPAIMAAPCPAQGEQ